VTPAWFAAHGIDAAAFALVVVDLSFISTIGLLAHLAGLTAPGTVLLALIKPQFELGPDARNARGIVRADADIAALRERVWRAALQAGWTPLDWTACALPGTDGNQEYFLHAVRGTEPISPTRREP
jgi:23S rRNA (cytidine1920-2'-O)/16S rRNA (cytidine1409-2'-O)-methyltransferase